MTPKFCDRRIIRHRLPFTALAAVVGGAVVLAGCGGDSAGSAAGTAAGYVPSATPLYFEISTDTAGPQWTQLTALARLFPGYADMKKGLDTGLSSNGIDWNTDVKPLLGKDVALAVPSLPEASAVAGALSDPAKAAGGVAATAAKQPVLAVLEIAPGKSAEMKKLLTSQAGSGISETGTKDDATLYADAAGGMYAAVNDQVMIIGSSQDVVAKALDAHAAGGDQVLSGAARFNEALAKLPSDVFAQAYINLEGIAKNSLAAVPQAEQLAGGRVTGVVAMSITAEKTGLRMKAVLVGAPPAIAQTEYSPTLLASAPQDVLAYVGFNRLAGTVQRALTSAGDSSSGDTKTQIDALTGQLPLLLGVTGDDLRNLTGGEQAVVVTHGRRAPAVSLMLQTANGVQAATSLAALSKSIPQVLNQFGAVKKKLPAWTVVDLGGVKGRQLALGGTGGVVWGVKGDLAVIGTQVTGVARVLSPPAGTLPLSRTPAFITATQGMPDQVTGVTWVNVARILPVLKANGSFRGKDGQRTLDSLRVVKNVAAWSSGGETPTVEVFLGMSR